MKIIGVRRAEGRDATPCLSETRRPAAVGVNDAADVGKRLVHLEVGWRIGGWFHVAFHNLACFQSHHDHVLGFQHIVWNPGGLNDHQPLRPVDARRIAKGESDQSMLWQQEIRLKHPFFQWLQHGLSLGLLIEPVC